MDIYSTLSLWLTGIRCIADTDDFCRQCYKLHTEGALSEADIIRLLEKVETRRAELKKARADGFAPPLLRRSYYPEREKSERDRRVAACGRRDQSRWARKRRLGDMAAIRPEFRDQFTEGERAVLYIVMSDWRQHGRCDRSVKEIGDRAGVGITTTRNALRKARNFGIIKITERRQWRAKNLTNVIIVTHARQIEWIKKFRPNLGLKFYPIAFKKPESTGTFGYKNKSGRPHNSSNSTPTGGLQPSANRGVP